MSTDWRLFRCPQLGDNGFRVPPGPPCVGCGLTEIECAYRVGCCEGCSHWLAYDPAGNLAVSSPGRPLLPVEHGTDRGYHQHRVRHEPACGPCRTAHTVRARSA